MNSNEKKVISSSEIELYGNSVKVYFDLMTYIDKLIFDKNGVDNVDIKKLIKEDTYFENSCRKLYLDNIKTIFYTKFGFTKTLKNMLEKRYDQIVCNKSPTISKDKIEALDNIFNPFPF